MERYDGSVVIGVDMDTDPAKKSVQGLGDKLKGSIAAAAKAATVALGAAVAGVAALSTAAVNSYGEYEQLVGGVGTLFKDSADTVMGYAENAYKTAGLSANEYNRDQLFGLPSAKSGRRYRTGRTNGGYGYHGYVGQRE